MSEQTAYELAEHPEEAALREEVARLRASLTAVLLQRDDLRLIQCRRIEAAYLRRFGALELKVYETWCEYLRAKRKVKLIRAERNRRAQPDPEAIETQLDSELADYRTELEERFRKVEGVMEPRKGPGLSRRGENEVRELYRRAVKALHPDLHPEPDEGRAQALDQAMRAYRAGDLATLRAICDTLEPQPGQPPAGLDELRAEARRLRNAIRSFDRELEAIKAAYPYNARVYLEDDEKGRLKEAELTDKLRELRAQIANYEQEIQQLLSTEDE